MRRRRAATILIAPRARSPPRAPESGPADHARAQLAIAHYRACDAIGLAERDVVALGQGTNDRIKGTLYGTFIRIFHEAGGGPWSVLPHWQRF